MCPFYNSGNVKIDKNICSISKQGSAGDTNSLVQDYLVWANIELGNFMTYMYNSYVNVKVMVISFTDRLT